MSVVTPLLEEPPGGGGAAGRGNGEEIASRGSSCRHVYPLRPMAEEATPAGEEYSRYHTSSKAVEVRQPP